MTTETRYPCPVCLGLRMEKLVLAVEAPGPAGRRSPKLDEKLVLDHCARCGGVWFEAGEVQRLRRCEAELLWRELVRREDPYVMVCHSCRSPLRRDEAQCGVCSWEVELDCPTCAQPMKVSTESGMSLDYCTRCKGVWFDHTELAGIWRLEMDAALARRRGHSLAAGGAEGLSDVLFYDPFLMYYGVHAAGHVLGAATHGLANSGAGAAIGEVAGAAGEAAAGLFETIVEIIAGIFG